MTQNKDFKRLVRDRALKTGESYTAARLQMRAKAESEPLPDAAAWRRVEKPEFGFAVHVPEAWEEFPPDLKASPWAVARFGERRDHRRGVTVFRNPRRPGASARDIAKGARHTLEADGFANFTFCDTLLGGIPAVRLDFDRRDAGRVWAVRQYVITVGAVVFCFSHGSSTPDEDASLFDAMAERFEVLA